MVRFRREPSVDAGCERQQVENQASCGGAHPRFRNCPSEKGGLLLSPHDGHHFRQRAVTVVVLSPPPVPEGEAPTNMTTVSRNSELIESPLIGIVLKPTVVLADITWNSEVSHACREAVTGP